MNSPPRRHFLQAALAVSAAAALGAPARAQQRIDTLRVLCGYPPGGSVDVVSRRLAERLGKGYARATLVENKPGAAGRLGVDALTFSAADGSALLVTPGRWSRCTRTSTDPCRTTCSPI